MLGMVVSCAVLLVSVPIVLASAKFLRQVHHLTMVVVRDAHCCQDEDNSEAGDDDGQSLLHSAAKLIHLFHICKQIAKNFVTITII